MCTNTHRSKYYNFAAVNIHFLLLYDISIQVVYHTIDTIYIYIYIYLNMCWANSFAKVINVKANIKKPKF